MGKNKSMCDHGLGERVTRDVPGLFEECGYCFSREISVCMRCFLVGCVENGHGQMHFQKSGHEICMEIQRTLEGKGVYSVEWTLRCLKCLAVVDVPDFLKETVEQVSDIYRFPIRRDDNVVLETCDHMYDVQESPREDLDKDRCGECGLEENLWICMTCGNVGCGRRQADGSGGNNHASEHFMLTTHPVSCKLGTISATSVPDVYCYVCDEMRMDENIENRLLCVGIDMKKMKKTESNIVELEMENVKEDAGIEDVLISPGFVGIPNLGNTCYISSLIQVLFHVDGFVKRYLEGDHVEKCRHEPHFCSGCQLTKICKGMYRMDKKALPESLDIGQFRQIVGKHYSEYASTQQQDAFEFFQHFVRLGKLADMETRARIYSMFDFVLIQRLECSKCGKRRHSKAVHCGVSIPMGTTLEESVDKYMEGEDISFTCSFCGENQEGKKYVLFETFPDILVIQMQRFKHDENWNPVKLTVPVDIPEMLDMNRYFCNESVECSDEEEDLDGELEMIVGMGFSEEQCRRARKVLGKSQDVDTIVAWIIEHGNHEDESVEMLGRMGVPKNLAEKALLETDHNVDRAIDWILSREKVESGNEEAEKGNEEEIEKSGTYSVVGCVVHRGPSVHCGHYVSYVKTKSHGWVLFNDNRVSKSDGNLVSQGYIVVLEKIVAK